MQHAANSAYNQPTTSKLMANLNATIESLPWLKYSTYMWVDQQWWYDYTNNIIVPSLHGMQKFPGSAAQLIA